MKKILMNLSIVTTLAVSLGFLPVSSAYAADDVVDVLIGFRNTPAQAEAAIVRNAGGHIKYSYQIVPAIAATLPSQALKGLKNNPNVTVVELDGTVHAIDQELDNAWGVKAIGSGIAHANGITGLGVNIAVIDSGTDYNHSELDGNFSGGYDFVNNDNDPLDDNGHGSHVSGTVGAEDDGAGVVGVAPGANMYALKVLNAAGSGSWSDIIAALDWAVANGIQVTNNSYGSSINPGGIVQAAFDNSAAAGIIHVAAAGNTGNPKGKGNKVGYPARYSSVIAVAAVDLNYDRASFSSTGDTVELAAPGVNITSVKLGGGYVAYNGTSMASPHVAGVAALVIQSGITDSDGDGNVVNEVRERLQITADDLGDPGRDPHFGFGLVDAAEASTPIGPVNHAPTVTITQPNNSDTFDSSVSINFQATANDQEEGDVSANIIWSSSINGIVGSGSSIAVVLSDGEHTITASADDSENATGSDSINITVGTPPPPPPQTALSVSVSTDKANYAHRERALITVVVTDGTNAVEGANVNVTIVTAKGKELAGSGLTNGAGIALFEYKVNSKRDGVGTYDVDATASKSGFDSGGDSTTFIVN